MEKASSAPPPPAEIPSFPAETPYPHLRKTTLKYMQLPDAERIVQVGAPIWIKYPLTLKLHERLDDLFYHPKVDRMPNALVCGHTNAGKSEAVTRWVNLKNANDFDTDLLPVLMVQAPFEPDVRQFLIACLEKLRVPYVSKDNPMQLTRQMAEVFETSQTKMIVVDEVHHMTAGNHSQQKKFMGALKFISNDLRMPVVAIGTKDALIAFQSDQQIGNRFEPFPVPRWENDGEFGRLLSTFEECLPLRKPSDLDEEELAAKLHYLSEGLIGELSTLLRRAAVAAIRTGRERIAANLIDGLGWVRTSERRVKASNAIK